MRRIGIIKLHLFKDSPLNKSMKENPIIAMPNHRNRFPKIHLRSISRPFGFVGSSELDTLPLWRETDISFGRCSYRDLNPGRSLERASWWATTLYERQATDLSPVFILNGYRLCSPSPKSESEKTLSVTLYQHFYFHPPVYIFHWYTRPRYFGTWTANCDSRT